VKRRYLRAKESRRVRDELVSKLTVASEFVSVKEPIELAEGSGYQVFFISGKPTFAKSKARLFPTLTNEEFISHFPTAVVDMGAVPFVCNGADVMAPGIVCYNGTFTIGEVVVVVDERYRRPLAVCFTLHDAEEVKKIKQGKVLENIHYVGDRLWTLLQGQNSS
jgi:PUA-domain protein